MLIITQVNIFNLSHDERYWDSPWEFKPERFLNENGDLLPAEHVNRKRYKYLVHDEPVFGLKATEITTLFFAHFLHAVAMATVAMVMAS